MRRSPGDAIRNKGRRVAVARWIGLLALLGCVAAARAEPGPGVVRSVLELRQQNVVVQNWDLSCAAAALATILRYQFGEPVTERSVALGLVNRPEYLANPELIRLRRGFSMLDMKRFVEGLGFQGIGLGQLGLEDLVARAPIIVPVDVFGYPHFVVFRGATGRRVLLADPAFGNITVSRREFLAAWIDYAGVGRVGFQVTSANGSAPRSTLSPRASEFVFLH